MTTLILKTNLYLILDTGLKEIEETKLKCLRRSYTYFDSLVDILTKSPRKECGNAQYNDVRKVLLEDREHVTVLVNPKDEWLYARYLELGKEKTVNLVLK